MGRFRVVITDEEYSDIEIERRILDTVGADVFRFNTKSEEEIIEVSKGCDALMLTFSQITKRIIETLDNCKIIARYAIGYDCIDLDAATKKEICVTNVPDYCVDEVSTHTVGLILDITRKLTFLNNDVKNGIWDYLGRGPVYSLSGQTLGLVGFGKIPRAVIAKIKPFGMDIITYDPYLSDFDAESFGVKKVTLDQLLEKSDIISLHSPLSKETTGIIDYNKLIKMKKSAYLINVGRGPLVNEHDLIDALNKGLICGAALDVTVAEPIEKDNPLLRMDNVIITPHSAWYSEKAKVTLQSSAAMEVARVLSGYYPKNLVNKAVKDKLDLKEF
jgi:D-3-phosphoglycerate dehydrogenase